MLEQLSGGASGVGPAAADSWAVGLDRASVPQTRAGERGLVNRRFRVWVAVVGNCGQCATTLASMAASSLATEPPMTLAIVPPNILPISPMFMPLM